MYFQSLLGQLVTTYTCGKIWEVITLRGLGVRYQLSSIYGKRHFYYTTKICAKITFTRKKEEKKKKKKHMNYPKIKINNYQKLAKECKYGISSPKKLENRVFINNSLNFCTYFTRATKVEQDYWWHGSAFFPSLHSSILSHPKPRPKTWQTKYLNDVLLIRRNIFNFNI